MIHPSLPLPRAPTPPYPSLSLAGHGGARLGGGGEGEDAVLGEGGEGVDVLEVGRVRQPLGRHALQEPRPHQPARHTQTHKHTNTNTQTHTDT
jgi:hypothetical protein